MRKSTWQIADVRRPLVSASHIIQDGNDLFIGKDEAYIMNRKKKEKSIFRKEGNVYVLGLFVRVPAWQRPSCTRPWRLTQSIKSKESQEGESRSTATAQLFDGRSSERGKQVQASSQTVEPQLCERCENPRECDSVLSATNDRTWRTERWDSMTGAHKCETSTQDSQPPRNTRST